MSGFGVSKMIEGPYIAVVFVKSQQKWYRYYNGRWSKTSKSIIIH